MGNQEGNQDVGRLGADAPTALAPPSGVKPASGLEQSRSSHGALDVIAMQIEDVLGNAPMREPSKRPTVGYSHGYHGNDPDAPDDTVPQEAFDEGHDRGWWEACQMLEPVLAALREQSGQHGTDWFAGDVDCDGNELITIRKDEWERLNGAYLSAVKGRQDFRTAYRDARGAAAQAIEARRAATGTGAVHESAVAESDAPTPQRHPGERP